MWIIWNLEIRLTSHLVRMSNKYVVSNKERKKSASNLKIYLFTEISFERRDIWMYARK